MKSNRIGILPLLAVTLGFISSVDLPAQVFNVSTDFTFTNPSTNGVFSYGTKVSPDSTALTTYDATEVVDEHGDNVDVFYSSTSPTGVDPNVTYNTSSGQIDLGPANGVNGLVSTVRFTAPTTGFYDVALVFDSDSPTGATTDVHLVLNGTSLFDGYINLNGDGSTATYSSSPLHLVLGDHVDFVVGNGNGSYVSDTTGLTATVTEVVPEPSTYALLSCGLLLLISMRKFRRFAALS